MRKSFLVAGIAVAVLIGGSVAYRHFVLVQPLKDRLLADMRDPESAQFRDVRLVSGWKQSNSSLCGEVNAKNGMGGYAGYQFFTVSSGGAYVESPDMKLALPTRPLAERCKADESLPWWWLTS